MVRVVVRVVEGVVVRRRARIWLGVVLLCSGFGACSRAVSPGSPVSSASPLAPLTHQVRAGETLSEIGAGYGIPFREIARLNNIENPDKILVGQQLQIPHGGQAPQANQDNMEHLEKAPQKDQVSQSQQAHRRPSERQRFAEPALWRRRPGQTRPEPKLLVSLPKEPLERPELPTLAPVYKEKSRFVWPAEGTLTSKYGPRNKSFHDGIDIAAPVGTPVVAAAAGEVIYSGKLRGYGKVIIVRHGKGYVSVYAHNNVNHAKEGQTVKQGQKLAEVGKTGRATGPNLHFEIRRNNKAQNPLEFLPSDRRIVRRDR